MFHSFSNRSTLIKKRTRKLGFKYFLRAPIIRNCTPRLVDSGLLILSKHPIIEYDFLLYSTSNSYDSLAAKGAIYARVLSNNDSVIHIFNTHLQATYMNSYYDDVEARNEQVYEFLTFVEEQTCNDLHPIFLMGDLNFNPSDPMYTELVDNLNAFDNVKSVLDVTDQSTFRGSIFNSDCYQKLDYMFLIEKENSEVAIDINADVIHYLVDEQPFAAISDHSAIYSDVYIVDKE
eukprot:TRINITY_DN2582_c0_g1_i2.p1 TRINITY_DN2582_c0_g1~~TRINITY_DN2582_c0_g1_i2.p1  ORF type:complete len:233 (-),score=26.22 TRINITY_DN2582_c0_g1_i2:24-722(-)